MKTPAPRALLCLAVLTLVAVSPSDVMGQSVTPDGHNAQPASLAAEDAEPGSELRVWLVTAGPGSAVWERYGHNALRVAGGALQVPSGTTFTVQMCATACPEALAAAGRGTLRAGEFDSNSNDCFCSDAFPPFEKFASGIETDPGDTTLDLNLDVRSCAGGGARVSLLGGPACSKAPTLAAGTGRSAGRLKRATSTLKVRWIRA